MPEIPRRVGARARTSISGRWQLTMYTVLVRRGRKFGGTADTPRIND